MIGKWSVVGGGVVGSTSHSVISSKSLREVKKLSGLEYFFVTICCRVGIPFGKAICRLWLAMSSMRFSAWPIACGVKRWMSLSLSHMG